MVTHRQRPATAGGITFVNLEDETGLINVICSKGLLGPLPHGGPHGPGPARAGEAGATVEGVINVVADKIEPPAGGGVGAVP